MKRITLVLSFLLISCSFANAAAPTLGSQDFLRASVSAVNLTLVNVDSGAGILVGILQNATAGRTYTVSDAVNGAVYSEISGATSTSCDGVTGTQRCTKFYFLASSASSASLVITVTQSSTIQGYAAFALEINCPITCQVDTASKFINTSTGTHQSSADSTVIDTAVDVFVVAACTGNQSGNESKEASFDGMVTEGVNDVQSMAQYKSTATALTDERGTFTSVGAGSTECGIVSIKNVAASAADRNRSLLFVGR